VELGSLDGLVFRISFAFVSANFLRRRSTAWALCSFLKPSMMQLAVKSRRASLYLPRWS
jgi:hypothetical protein